MFAKCKQLAFDFFEEQKKFKQAQSEFDETKRRFYSEMEKFFETEQINKSCSFLSDEGVLSKGELEVNRIQKSSVVFDSEKLEKVLSKEICKNVIQKKYEVVDMQGLITYLRECNVDPKTFKSFLSISKTVNIKELERLEEIGKITLEQLKGCYTVKNQNPYFTVSFKNWNGENE